MSKCRTHAESCLWHKKGPGHKYEAGEVFDCSSSLFNHGVAQRERLNLSNLNPVNERVLTKLGVYHEVEGG